MNDLPRLNRVKHPSQTSYPERIVQFGGGNFLRAFLDWIVDILNEQAEFASSVVIVKVTPHETYKELDEQDGLFHVVTQGIQNSQYITETRLVTCVKRTVYPYLEYQAYIALAQQPEIRFLFSNTTESGIHYEPNDQADDQPPDSFPAKLTQFLYARYQHFDGATDKGCFIIPTELIEDNGTQLREIILSYAKAWQLPAEFAHWVSEHNIFCNTLVDRIVTGFPGEQADALQQQIGYEDRLLVVGEPYLSWVIEAPESLRHEFPIDRTNLNIKIVADVNPYRATKVRILNGLHTAMVMLGYLMGLRSVRECIEHPDLAQFLQDTVHEEIIPSLDLPESELKEFTATVFDRFRNPSIHHRLLAIAVNSSAKIRTRIMPSLHEFQQKQHRLPNHLVLVIAAFIRFYKGEWQGDSIPLQDDVRIIEDFKTVWQNEQLSEEQVTAILSNSTLWGENLNQMPDLSSQIYAYLNRINTDGILLLIRQINGVN